MPIRITCRHCGKSFSAWDDLIGKSVQCPKCQQSMIVQTTGGTAPASSDTARGSTSPPVPTSRQGPAEKARPMAPKPGAPQPGASQPAAPKPGAPQPVSPRPAAPRPVSPGPAIPARAAGSPPVSRPSPAPSPARPKGAASGDNFEDFDDREDLPFGCPNCNAAMEPDDDLCNACGYHLILKKVIDMEGVHRADASTGFDRVVKRHLDESESTAGMLFWAKMGGLFFLVLVCFVCLGAWGLAIGAAVVAGYFIYAARLRIKAEDNPSAHVELDPIAALMWSAMLTFQRIFGWRSLSPPFGTLRVLTLRDGSFTNDALGQVEDLAKLQVLDLEGTGITDAGLSHLKGRKKLCFLVLKNTAVTPEGVGRLQQSLPTAWIWY